MIIYPLPAQELDDASLSRQIKNIAQVLCNVHHADIACLTDIKKIEESSAKIPLPQKRFAEDKICWWARECRANYLKLVEIGLLACEEYSHRFCNACNKCKEAESELETMECGKCFGRGILPWTKKHKLQPVIEWCAQNVPELAVLTNQPDCIVDFANCFGKFNDLIGDGVCTPFPLMMPDKYQEKIHDIPGQSNIEWAITQSYRNYYKANIKKKLNKLDCNNLPVIDTDPDYPKWTQREVPDYIKQLLGT